MENNGSKIMGATLGNPVFVNVAVVGVAVVGGYFIVKYFMKNLLPKWQTEQFQVEKNVRDSVDSILQPPSVNGPGAVTAQMPENQTRLSWYKNYLSSLVGQGGGRALNDYVSNPVGTLAFLLTGDTDNLKN